MQRNAQLLKLIIPFTNTWFWLGIWLPFYLRFTNYAGVGLIETIVLSIGIMLEIPTGAIADLLGKKKTIFIALILLVVGELFMGTARHVNDLYISVIFMTIGMTLMSGTWEALLYDSLKQIKKEETYSTLLSTIEKRNLVFMSVASFIGGHLYVKYAGLPFLATAVFVFIALLLCVFLEEPLVKVEEFSASNYFKQTKQGFGQLFKEKQNINWLVKLLLLFSLSTILMEVLDTSLALNFGFSEKQLGVIYSIVPLITALGVHMYPRFKEKVSRNTLWAFIFFSFVLSVVISPVVGMVIGGMLIFYRNIFYSVINVMSSDTVNKSVESRYRATTLSTFTMLRKVPYVVVAFAIGRYIDSTSSFTVGLYVGLLFLALGILLIVYQKKEYKSS